MPARDTDTGARGRGRPPKARRGHQRTIYLYDADHDLISQAAEIERTSISGFLAKAATAEAARVLKASGREA